MHGAALLVPKSSTVHRTADDTKVTRLRQGDLHLLALGPAGLGPHPASPRVLHRRIRVHVAASHEIPRLSVRRPPTLSSFAYSRNVQVQQTPAAAAQAQLVSPVLSQDAPLALFVRHEEPGVAAAHGVEYLGAPRRAARHARAVRQAADDARGPRRRAPDLVHVEDAAREVDLALRVPVGAVEVNPLATGAGRLRGVPHHMPERAAPQRAQHAGHGVRAALHGPERVGALPPGGSDLRPRHALPLQVLLVAPAGLAEPLPSGELHDAVTALVHGEVAPLAEDDLVRRLGRTITTHGANIVLALKARNVEKGSDCAVKSSVDADSGLEGAARLQSTAGVSEKMAIMARVSICGDGSTWTGPSLAHLAHALGEHVDEVIADLELLPPQLGTQPHPVRPSCPPTLGRLGRHLGRHLRLPLRLLALLPLLRPLDVPHHRREVPEHSRVVPRVVRPLRLPPHVPQGPVQGLREPRAVRHHDLHQLRL